jgi:hypothetical protein
VKIDLTKLAAEMREAAAEHIDSERPAFAARHALVGALARLTVAYREAGIEQVSRYDLSDLTYAVGNLKES